MISSYLLYSEIYKPYWAKNKASDQFHLRQEDPKAQFEVRFRKDL